MDRDPERVKIDALSEKIRQAEPKAPSLPEKAEPMSASFSRVGFDLLGGILGGGLLGWGMGLVFPVLSPWAMIVMICVGFVFGLMNVWRALTGPEPEK